MKICEICGLEFDSTFRCELVSNGHITVCPRCCDATLKPAECPRCKNEELPGRFCPICGLDLLRRNEVDHDE